MKLILGLRKGSANKAYSAPLDKNRYMFFATRARVNSSMLVAAAATNYKCVKTKYGVPEYSVNDFRLHYSGFGCLESGLSPQETILPVNNIIIDEVWISPDDGATKYQCKFAGADGIVIGSNANGAWTDSIILPSAVASLGTLTVFTIYHTAVGENQLGNARVQDHRGERVWGGTDLSSVKAFLATPNAASDATLYNDTLYGQSQPQYYSPDFMVSKGWDGRPVALVTCDSIGHSRQEFAVSADARGNLGYVARWLDKSSDAGRVPFMLIGTPGATAGRECNTSATKRFDIIDEVKSFNSGRLPFTVILNQLGNNDIGANLTTSTNNLKGLYTRLKARYPTIKKIDLFPLCQTTSSNLYQDAAGQTASGNNVYPTGNRYLLMDAIAASTDINDGWIENRAVAEDAGNRGKWVTGQHTPILTAQAGTDGVATYDTLYVDRAGTLVDETLTFGTTALRIKAVSTDGKTLTLRTPQTVVIPNGTQLGSSASPDGVHPYPRTINTIVNAISQTEKTKLAETIVPTSYQIIANQTAITNVLRAGNNGGRTDVQNQNRQFHICGKGAVTSLRIGMTGYRVPSTGGAAVAIGNDYTLEAAFEKVSPASSTRFLFSGANSSVVSNGASLVLSDPLSVNIGAGEQFAIRKNITIASETMNFPDATSYLIATDSRYTSPSATSQLLNTSAMTTPTGGTPAGAAIAACLLGIPSIATPAVVIVGDSIANGSTDNARGYIIRGLDGVNGYSVPWSRSTVNSWSYNAASTSTQIQAIWSYCTHVLFELGVNDIQNGRTLSQIQANMTALWTAAKAVKSPYGKPLKVYQTIITPKTNSTDSFATIANQTMATGFTTGGIRDQLNSWIKAQVGLGLLDGFVDPTIYCEDQSNLGKWVVNGTANYATADGIHPSTTFHQAMAAAVNNWAKDLTV